MPNVRLTDVIARNATASHHTNATNDGMLVTR